MNGDNSKLWDEMLEEFRALGGTADNVRLGSGRYGRGLFPIDPSRPVKIHIPEPLLIEFRHVSVVNGNFSVNADAPIGERERRFLENYQRDFSWGVTCHETEGLLQMFQAAPAELRELLSNPFHLDPWLAGSSLDAVLERFLSARMVQYKGKNVIMPIVELANHGHMSGYELDDGVGLSGTFEDEVLVLYTHGDPLWFFHHWGFVSRVETFALSVAFGMKQVGLSLRRQEVGADIGKHPFYPIMEKEDGLTTLSFMLLGHKNYPRIPRGIFYKVCREAGIKGAEELFERIQHTNRTQFLRLAELSETAAPRLGRMLRSLAYAQLELMSHSFGVREP